MSSIPKLVNTFCMPEVGEEKTVSRQEVGREREARERESFVVCKNFSTVISYEMHHRASTPSMPRACLPARSLPSSWQWRSENENPMEKVFEMLRLQIPLLSYAADMVHNNWTRQYILISVVVSCVLWHWRRGDICSFMKQVFSSHTSTKVTQYKYSTVLLLWWMWWTLGRLMLL